LNQRLRAIDLRSDFPGGAGVPPNGARVQPSVTACPRSAFAREHHEYGLYASLLKSSVQVLARPMLLITRA
jgi:hypothetical protein